MRLLRRIIFLVLSVSLLNACSSVSYKEPEHPASSRNILVQPQKAVRVGLALGGGASKGFAHIGVLKVLAENDIPVHIVTGTSAGAVVGSLYASGMSEDRIELESEIINKTDLADFTLSKSGFLKGEKLQDFINRKVENKNIQQFPKKFAAVATDFETGKSVAFNYGNAGQAVRASSSIPGVFQPVQIAGRSYVDGGLSAPVPVSAAKKLGADIVIAVDISDKPQKNLKDSLFALLGQTINIMSQSALQVELSQADVIIRPDVLDLGSVGGFEQREDAIKQGENAARKALPQIKAKLKAAGYRKIK